MHKILSASNEMEVQQNVNPTCLTFAFSLGVKIGQYFSEELGAHIYSARKTCRQLSTYKLQKEFQKCSSMLSKSLSSGQMISKQSWARLKRLNSCQTSMEGLGKQFQTNLTKGEGQKKLIKVVAFYRELLNFFKRNINENQSQAVNCSIEVKRRDLRSVKNMISQKKKKLEISKTRVYM